MKIKIDFEVLVDVVKQDEPEVSHEFLSGLLDKYMVNCVNCGKQFFSKRPELAKYCSKCKAMNIAYKVYKEKNPEKVREYDRNWARKRAAELKALREKVVELEASREK